MNNYVTLNAVKLRLFANEGQGEGQRTLKFNSCTTHRQIITCVDYIIIPL